jgi:hypothetical protein
MNISCQGKHCLSLQPGANLQQHPRYFMMWPSVLSFGNSIPSRRGAVLRWMFATTAGGIAHEEEKGRKENRAMRLGDAAHVRIRLEQPQDLPEACESTVSSNHWGWMPVEGARWLGRHATMQRASPITWFSGIITVKSNSWTRRMAVGTSARPKGNRYQGTGLTLIPPSPFCAAAKLLDALPRNKKRKRPPDEGGLSHCLNGAPGRIRTSDHLVRSQVLYPAELRARCCRRALSRSARADASPTKCLVEGVFPPPLARAQLSCLSGTGP